MGKGFCDVGCDCLTCINASLRSRIRELEGLVKRLADDKQRQHMKIIKLERAVEWALTTLDAKNGDVWWARLFADELRKRAGMEG